jgi:hypothetical protein
MHKTKIADLSVAAVNSFARLMGIKAGDKGKPVTKPTIVYRVEFPDGHGPYNSHKADARKIYEVLCGTGPMHPGFNCAQLARVNHEQCGITENAFQHAHGEADYGCLTLKAIGNWFCEDARKYLHGLGVKLNEYEVPKGGYLARLGSGEVLFARSKAKHVRELDLVTLG